MWWRVIVRMREICMNVIWMLFEWERECWVGQIVIVIISWHFWQSSRVVQEHLLELEKKILEKKKELKRQNTKYGGRIWHDLIDKVCSLFSCLFVHHIELQLLTAEVSWEGSRATYCSSRVVFFQHRAQTERQHIWVSPIWLTLDNSLDSGIQRLESKFWGYPNFPSKLLSHPNNRGTDTDDDKTLGADL